MNRAEEFHPRNSFQYVAMTRLPPRKLAENWQINSVKWLQGKTWIHSGLITLLLLLWLEESFSAELLSVAADVFLGQRSARDIPTSVCTGPGKNWVQPDIFRRRFHCYQRKSGRSSESNKASGHCSSRPYKIKVTAKIHCCSNCFVSIHFKNKITHCFLYCSIKNTNF